MNEHVKQYTTGGWEQDVLGAPGLVLVDFWAEWCPPCRKLSPVIDILAEEYAGRVAVGKLDVDAEPAVAARYGVMSIPTLLVFRDGKVVEQRVGALPKEELRRILDAHVETPAAV